MKRSIIYNTLIICAITTIATGCVTKKYQRPELPVEKSYRGTENTDTANVAKVQWREYFADQNLSRLIDEALTNNFDLAVAMQRIEESRAYYRQSKAAFYPSLNAQVQGTINKPSEYGLSYSPLMNYPLRDIQLGFSTSWEIDVWGKLSSANRSQLASLLGQQASKNAIVTKLISDIASAYYQLVSLDFKKTITLQTIENRREYLETVRALKKSGKVNEVAVKQAEAQLAGAEAYIPEFDQAIFVTENYISLLVGRNGGRVDRTEGMTVEHLNFLVKGGFDIGVPAQLLQYRPDIIMAEFSLRSAHESLNVAKASLYPSLTLSGNAGTDATTFSKWFAAPQSILWSAVAGITEPIWNGRKLRTQKNVAESRKNQALLQFKQTLISAQNEVSNAITTVRSQHEKAKFQFVQYEALDKAYSYSIDLFINGYATYLDVLTAQDGVFNTYLSLVDTYQSKASAQIDLYRALGGGWDMNPTLEKVKQDKKDKRVKKAKRK